MKKQPKESKVVVEVAGEVITPEQAARKAAQLRSIIYDSIQPVQVRDMMHALMARAGNGEHKATMTVLQLLGVGQPAPSSDLRVNVEQAENVNMLHAGPGHPHAAPQPPAVAPPAASPALLPSPAPKKTRARVAKADRVETVGG